MKSIFIIFGLISAMVGCVFGAPWFDLFARPRGYGENRPRQHREGKSGGERWKEICRTITADTFGFPGQTPYSSGPVCPW